MKYKFSLYIVVIFMLSNITLYSNEYNVYQQELVQIYKVGNSKGEFILDLSTPYDNGPSAISFDANGKLYIVDIVKYRLVVFYNNKFVNEYYNLFSCKSRQLEIREDYLISYGDQCISIDNIDFRKKAIVYLNESIYKDEIPNITNIIFTDDIIFLYLKNGSILSISNLGLDWEENNKKILGHNETEALFEFGEKYNLFGLTIDDKKRIFLNGELLTRNYEAFYKYWEEINIDMKDHKFIPLKPEYSDNAIFIGKDVNNNFYWDIGLSHIYVFNKNGLVLELFKYNKKREYKTLPAIHPSGDVYFLDYDENGVYLYRVKNVWDPEGRERWHKESGVKDLEPIDN